MDESRWKKAGDQRDRDAKKATRELKDLMSIGRRESDETSGDSSDGVNDEAKENAEPVNSNVPVNRMKRRNC